MTPNYLYCALILIILVLKTYGLNCRSEGGPKENELKSIYMNCLKRQDNSNSSDTRGNNDDSDWGEPKRHAQRKNWNDQQYGNDKRDSFSEMGNRGANDRIGNKNNNERRNSGERHGNKDHSNSNGEMPGDRQMGDKEMFGGRDDRSKSNVRFGKADRINGRDDFPSISEEFRTDLIPNFNTFGSGNQRTNRFKREKNSEKNSGQRSQYNPNSKKTPSQGELNSAKEMISSENNTKADYDNKACALHCFLEELKMVGEDGKPDRYMVTHVITKDVTNEDLKDFLEESIEDCFQILANEDPDEKCKFSKKLMLCLSEKGRANCDDWKDDVYVTN